LVVGERIHTTLLERIASIPDRLERTGIQGGAFHRIDRA
jgi:hypothetical protein